MNVPAALLAFVLFFGGIVIFVCGFEAPLVWNGLLCAGGILVNSSALFLPHWLADRVEERALERNRSTAR